MTGSDGRVHREGVPPAIAMVTYGALRAGRAIPYADPHAIATMDERRRAAYQTLPFEVPDDTPVQLLALDGEVVIGREDLLPGRVLVEGVPVATSWGSGMFVPAEHRGRGIGRRLAERRADVHPIRLSCGVSQMLLPIYLKLGWQAFPMTRWLLLRRGRSVVERVLRNRALARIGSGMIDCALATQHLGIRGLAAMRLRRYLLESALSCPDECAEALARIRAPASTERTPATINWMLRNRFSDDDRARQLLFVLRDRGSGHCAAYVLIKLRYHAEASHRGFRNVMLGSVQDWMTFDAHRLPFGSIVLASIIALREEQVDALEFCVPPQEDARALRRLGFLRLGAQQFLYSAAPGSILSEPRFRDPAAWWFRPGDGDNVFV